MKTSRILLACLAALAFAAPALVLRVSAEVRPGVVGVAVTESVLDHWEDLGEPDAEVFGALESAGIRTVVLGMPSIRSSVMVGEAQILESGDPLVLRGPDAFLALVRSRFGAAASVDEDRETVTVTGVRGALDKPLGYPPDRVAELRAADLELVLALPGRERDLRWLEGEIARTRSRMVLVTGQSPPPGLASLLAERGLELAVSDFVPGEGEVSTYGARLAGKLVRAHLIELKRSDDIETVTIRARRAEKERGVRLIVFQAPPDFPGAGPALEQAAALATAIQRELPPGLIAGDPMPQPPVAPPVLVRLLTVVAAFSLASLTLLVIPRGLAVVGLVGLVAFGVAGAVAVVADQLMLLQLFTLAAAVIGATLAVLTRRYLLGCLVAVTTGLVVAALGAQSTFMNGTTSFLGVKALLLTPPVLVAVLAAFDLGFAKLRSLVWPLRLWHALVVVALVVAGAFYVVRSGNSGLVPDFELALRDRLDELMYIRPRFKEALLGFPALFVAARWKRDTRWLWAIVATVGTASAVDTFAHFHTPVLAALLRTGYAIAIGLVLGWLISLVLEAIRKRVRT